MSYRLRTLGSIRIVGEDGSEVHLRSAKHTALFVYLNANSRRTYLRPELCELFWTTERNRARHSLSQALYDIRSRVGPVVGTGGGEGVTLDAPGAWYDVDELEARMARDEPEAAAELYAGPFAVELERVGTESFEYWLDSERRRIQVVGRNAYRQHIASLEERGAWKRLAEVARRFLKRAPADADAQRAFIRSLWLGGDRASALEHFSSLREQRPDLAERLRSLVDRIEGRSSDRVKEAPEPEEPPLVGREEELSRLRRVSRSLEGPAVIHLQGEAGIGKTRLVAELEKVLDLDDFEVIQSRCWEAERDVPYAAVAEGLEPWLGPSGTGGGVGGVPEEARLARAALFPRGDEPGSLAADREALKELRRRVFEEVTGVVRGLAEGQPTLWVIEDIQWIDHTSAALLHYVIRRLTDVPLLLLFTSRPSMDREDGLSRYLDQPAAVEYLTLGPLDRPAVRDLLDDASDDDLTSDARERIAELSGGNPYFALELLRAYRERREAAEGGADELLGRELVDDRLESVLRERLRSVSVDGLKVLEAVAVLGGRAPWDLVLSLARVEVNDPSWICEQLSRQRLLATGKGTVEFTHDILREYVYADLGDIRRYSLHQMAAERLARQGEVSRGVLAKHFHLGGDPGRAFHYALAAARDAESRGAHEEAARYADVALDASDGDREAAEVELRRLAARAYSAAGELSEAARRLKPLLKTEMSSMSEATIRGLLELAEIWVEEAKMENARRSLRTARDGIDSSLSGTVAEGLVAERLSIQLRVEIHDGARAAIDASAERVMEILDRRRSIAERYRVRAGRALAAYLAFFESADAAYALLGEMLALEAPTRTKLRLLSLRGLVEQRRCNWDRAEYLFQQGRNRASERNDVTLVAMFLNNLGCLQMERGRWQEAKETLTNAEAYYSSANPCSQWSVHPILNLGNTALYQLRTSEARDRYFDVIEASQEMQIQKYEAEARACLGLLDLQRGDRRSAERQYRKIRELVDHRSLSQERFKVDWFSIFCGENGSPETSLRKRAEEYGDTDRLSQLKLLWLAEISDGEGRPDENVRSRLRDDGLLWFEKFGERWMRATRGNRAAV